MPPGNQKQFFGQKISVPGINVNNAGDNQLLYKNDYNTTTYYNKDGKLVFGVLPDGTFGLSQFDNSGFQLFKMNGSTWFWYDKVNNVNVMQIGLLPDGTYGFAVAKTGSNVSDIFA